MLPVDQSRIPSATPRMPAGRLDVFSRLDPSVTPIPTTTPTPTPLPYGEIKDLPPVEINDYTERAFSIGPNTIVKLKLENGLLVFVTTGAYIQNQFSPQVNFYIPVSDGADAGVSLWPYTPDDSQDNPFAVYHPPDVFEEMYPPFEVALGENSPDYHIFPLVQQ
ncbi:hypothetical protein GF357_00070 [Candidatus Dojkabacteria bacterium]|nr:hypothetical protein [Candidatus Dojkabacteria bacterium]